jgi:DNA-binding winged helix-turn-helix (wHTH) protein
MKVAFGRFTFDSDTREIVHNGLPVHLSPKAFDLLHLLLERRPNVVTKAEVQERIWPGTFVQEANLNVVVGEIRRVLSDDPKAPRFIRTVHRVGYAFCGTSHDVAGSTGDTGAIPFSGCWLVWNERTFPLASGENVVGRDPRCGVWIDASGVSRRHARICIAGTDATLEDLDSSNGTGLRGQTLEAGRHRLADGDEIRLGSATMKFRMWSEERPPKTERLV